MQPVLAEKKKAIKVLVAIDDSEESIYALEWALDNLFTSGAESMRKAQKQNSTNVLSGALKICKQRPVVKVETLIMEGDPKDMICQAAEQMDTDFLVVGSRGLGKIKRAFLGSVSDYCAHHARCPFLIVKPPHH
ncbi:hypothetical protein MKW94_003909 [Papaver nudicaule]|uniref:UspA domain-containing protein n=1 Tax=Papaver nudicaule TaxID=74823 RepID=A0AA41VH02_PAPNU|nr:hypothetical protein [Papaver nudicaule]